MILLRMELAARERRELFGLIDVIPIVAIVFDRECRALVACEEFRKRLFEAREVERPALFLEISKESIDSLLPPVFVAERLDGHMLSFPFTDHVEDPIFLGPLDVVRFTPHVEIREREMGILIITAGKITVQHRFVFFLQ